jgi:hypothetical protein
MRRFPSDEGGIPTQPASPDGWPKWLRRTVTGVFAALAATALIFVYFFGVVVGFCPPITRPRGVSASAHFVSMQFEYDHRNSNSRPLVLVGARDCIRGDPTANSGWGFGGCD